MPDPIVREAIGAGRWFPARADSLRAAVETCLSAADVSLPPGRIVAALSPHAGLPYSGPVAGYTFRALQADAERHDPPDVVVILGFSHTERFSGLALMDGDAIETPLGRTPLDRAAASLLVKSGDRIAWNYGPHRGEHSAENQVPFVQTALKGVPVVIGLMGDHDAVTLQQVVRGLNRLAETKHIVLLSSTDMLHDADYERVTRTDQATLALVASLDHERILSDWSPQHQTFCGIFPVSAALQFAAAQGARKGTLLRYRNSGDDHPESRGQWVVGYAAVVFAVANKTP